MATFVLVHGGWAGSVVWRELAPRLRQDERRAIETRNFLALYDMGLHPYLGGQLARLIFGNEAGKGATVAVNKLVESLQGKGSVA